MREAEEAALREQQAAAGAAADPFTRRKCQPTVVTKTTDDSIRQQRRDRVEHIYRMDMPDDKRLWKVNGKTSCQQITGGSISTVFHIIFQIHT